MMRRTLLPLARLALAAAVAALVSLPLSAQAAQAPSWIFQRSYYSHFPTQSVTVGRQLAGGPRFSQPQGGYVNSGLRRMNTWIQIPGMGFDQTQLWESWGQTGTQW